MSDSRHAERTDAVDTQRICGPLNSSLQPISSGPFSPPLTHGEPLFTMPVVMNPRSFDDYDDFFGPYLGSILLRARKEKRVSQMSLAEMVQISDGTLRRIEIGQGPMRPKLVMAICNALGLRLKDVVLEALFSFWMDFQKKAEEDGEDGSADLLGPYRRLRENILDRFDANAKTQRELIEAHLDMEAFIHFKRSLEDQKD